MEMEVDLMDKPKGYLAPDVVLSYITGIDNELDEIIDSKRADLVLSDFALKESLLSLEHSDNLDISKLLKLIDYCEFIRSDIKLVFREERKKHLRETAKLDKNK